MDDTWQRRLDAATSEAEVVAVARDFVGQLRSDVISRLPADLRPGMIGNATEVTAYAFSVALHRLQDGGADLSAQVEVIATFFMSAATRLTHIVAKRPKASDSA